MTTIEPRAVGATRGQCPNCHTRNTPLDRPAIRANGDPDYRYLHGKCRNCGSYIAPAEERTRR